MAFLTLVLTMRAYFGPIVKNQNKKYLTQIPKGFQFYTYKPRALILTTPTETPNDEFVIYDLLKKFNSSIDWF
jgi:hypothetical protein